MNKRLILSLAKRSGLFWLSRRLTGRGLRILCYHGIWNGDGHYGDRLYMSPAKFATRMRELAASGYPVLGLDEALNRQRDGTLPACATVITIDDGWYGCYPHMFPVLTELGLPSTLYVTSYYADKQTPVFNVVLGYMLNVAKQRTLELSGFGIAAPSGATAFDLDDEAARERAFDAVCAHADTQLDNDQRVELARDIGHALGVDFDDIESRRLFHIMDAEQLADIAKDGVDIQLHTHRHRIRHEGRSTLTAELATNREWLKPYEAVPLRHFCYPSGEYERTCFGELAENDIVSATTCDNGINFPGAEPYALRRILDGESADWLEIEAELSGFIELTRQAKRLLGRTA